MSGPGEEGVENMFEFIPSAHSTADQKPYGSTASEEEKEYRKKLAEHVDRRCKLQRQAPLSCAKAV